MLSHCCLLTKEDSVAKKLPFANICWYSGPAGGERLARIKSVWEVLRLYRDGEVGLIFLDQQLYTEDRYEQFRGGRGYEATFSRGQCNLT